MLARRGGAGPEGRGWSRGAGMDLGGVTGPEGAGLEQMGWGWPRGAGMDHGQGRSEWGGAGPKGVWLALGEEVRTDGVELAQRGKDGLRASDWSTAGGAGPKSLGLGGRAGQQSPEQCRP